MIEIYATGGIGVSSQFAKEEYAIGVSGNAQVNASLEYNANLEGEAGAQKTRSKLITHNKDGFVYDQFKFAARSLALTISLVNWFSIDKYDEDL